MIRKNFNNIFLILHSTKHIAIMICFILIFANTIFIDSYTTYAASTPYATGSINSSDGVNVRKSTSTKSDIVFGLNNNSFVYINKIVFVSKNKTSKTKKWFYISAEGKEGYVRADLIDNIKYFFVSAKTTAKTTYRVGAGTGMKKKGALKKGKKIKMSLIAKAHGSNKKWYRIKVGSKSYYATSNNIKIIENTSKNNNSSACEAAQALSKKSTIGGKVRKVYTFTSLNCKKKFSVKGSSTSDGGKVPQGMAFDGSNYYILFAMDNTKQCIAKYSKDGNKEELTKFKKNVGHLNGMTWDPNNNILLIMKGNQHGIYTYNPSLSAFGTSSTSPRSNSGAAYDEISGLMFFSSRSWINIYDIVGDKYNYQRCITRCTRSNTYYSQDCAAYNGFVFHCISTGDKTGNQNYIDVYRSSDAAYLGTIQFEMGEIESAVVNNGYLEILCNTPGTPDYIWETPLKVTDLQ